MMVTSFDFGVILLFIPENVNLPGTKISFIIDRMHIQAFSRHQPITVIGMSTPYK